MKKILGLFLCTVCTLFVSAQGVEEVTLVVSGEGATKEDATNVALRSAIEQAFGCFVSANTTIINDDMIKDEVVTSSAGNVKSFKELSVLQLESGGSFVTLEAVVSISKLISYAQSKGSSCEFAGATYGANMRSLKLNIASEKKILDNLLTMVKQVDNLYDCELKVGDPDVNGKIHIVVTAIANANTYNVFSTINATIKALGKNYEFIKTLPQGCKYKGFPVFEVQFTRNPLSHVTEFKSMPKQIQVSLINGTQEEKNKIHKNFTYYYEDIALYDRSWSPGYGERYSWFYKLWETICDKFSDIQLVDNLKNIYTMPRLSIGSIYSNIGVVDGSNGEYICVKVPEIIPCTASDFTRSGYHPCPMVLPYPLPGATCFNNDFNLLIPIATLTQISRFELRTKKNEVVGTPNYMVDDSITDVILNRNHVSQATMVNGVHVCTTDTYDFGEIKANDKVNVIFRFGGREKGNTYIVAKPRLTMDQTKAKVVSCYEVKGDCYDLMVTCKPGRLLAVKGEFNIPIDVELHNNLGEIAEKKIYIKGIVK